MNCPKVSIIIPVYDVEQYIERCVRSLFEQTLDEIEYLFIDDCTPDNSIQVLQKVLEDYPHRKEQVVIHRMDRNSGQAAVRKWGIQNAKGEFLIHCDSDDWVDRDMYRTLYDQCIFFGSDVAVCNYAISDGIEVKKIRNHSTNNKDENLRGILLGTQSNSLWNKLVSRSLFENKDFIFPCCNNGEDLVICAQIYHYAQKVVHIDRVFYYYCKNPMSITNNPSEECVIERCRQVNENVCLVSNFIFLHYGEQFEEEIIRLKFLKRNLLMPILGNRKNLSLWRKTFPEINVDVFLSKFISSKEKFRFLLTFMSLYPIKHR